MGQGRTRRVRHLSAAIFAWSLTGCRADVIDPAGPIGQADKTILFNALAIMLAIVLPVIVATIGVAWWFLAGNHHAQRRPDWAFSGRVEFVTWSIPVLVILFLGGITWIGAHTLDPAEPIESKQAALDVDVVALDWKWLFIYPGQNVASVNRLLLPVGVPVHFHITSATVMNAFFIPRLGSMIYAMNGMETQLYLQADRPGDYAGLSAHFSGDGFSDMRFTAHAVAPRDFQTWIETTRTQGAVLDRAAYARLERESKNVAPFTYRQTQPDLFEAIVKQTVPPSKGPDTPESESKS